MIDRTKPGSAMECVLKVWPKARCQQYDTMRPGMRYAVKVSAKSQMILATGPSAQIAWNRAADAL